MNVDAINKALLQGAINEPGLFPHLDNLHESTLVLDIDFGLQTLPEIPGLLTIRGPRQFGKSTWLESQLYLFCKEHGPGSAFYLNGDVIIDQQDLLNKLESILHLFSKKSKHKAIFIDEITSIPNWEKSFKILADRNQLKSILVITTGSKATDLRRGHERLPGRKGKIDRTEYLFTPISYSEFHKKCHKKFRQQTLIAYLISGGSPIAITELMHHNRIPEYLITLTRDWIIGEIASSGRDRSSLLSIFEVIFKFAGTPVGFTKLAKEAGMANNTVASGYIELLKDLLCITTIQECDPLTHKIDRKKPSKFTFINLLAAIAFHPAKIRTLEDFQNLTANEQGQWLEWLVSQELYRRNAILGLELPEELYFWKNQNHEIDFFEKHSDQLIEVKRGPTSQMEFSWFPKTFPQKKLSVLSSSEYETNFLHGQKIESWLLAY